MTAKTKLIVQLQGGIGNQMFQYAAAYSLAKRNGAALVLDTWSGFVLDKQYKRHYELDALPISARKTRPFELLPFWINRISNKVSNISRMTIRSHWYGVFLNETKQEFLPDVFNYQMKASCWMTGYWQSARYFTGDESLIQSQLSPPIPGSLRFRELAQKMRKVNSVALGVRLYEESTTPGAHSADGYLKSMSAISEAAKHLADLQKKDCHYFIFCTHRSPVLKHLKLYGDVTYVTHDDEFTGTIERLWLLTQCRHHIMTNSSYYWWGAWLSRSNYPLENSEVFAADNFINKDSVLPNWHLF